MQASPIRKMQGPSLISTAVVAATKSQSWKFANYQLRIQYTTKDIGEKQNLMY